MLTKIYIHYITTLFVLYLFHLKGKKIGIGIGIGQFARKKSVSESAKKNHDRCITKIYNLQLLKMYEESPLMSYQHKPMCSALDGPGPIKPLIVPKVIFIIIDLSFQTQKVH